MRFLFVILGVSLLLLAGCVRIQTVEGDRVPIMKSVSLAAAANAPDNGKVLRAMVKGSIYETGEMVTVFGTCLGPDDQPVSGTYAVMSSWYPNGTAFFANVSMSVIQQGYYMYTGSMNVVQGTYLTEMTCFLNGTDMVARAFGEWQNPVWVARIRGINQSVEDVKLLLNNVSVTMDNSFAITWSKLDQLNSTALNISSKLDYIAMVANASVDRNDSLIVQMLQQILVGMNGGGGGNNTGVIVGSVSEFPIDARYLKQWALVVQARDNFNNRLSGSQVTCRITSNNLPPVNETMDYYASVSDFRIAEAGYSTEGKDSKFTSDLNGVLSPLIGGFWYHQELMRNTPSQPFNYNVNCV